MPAYIIAAGANYYYFFSLFPLKLKMNDICDAFWWNHLTKWTKKKGVGGVHHRHVKTTWVAHRTLLLHAWHCHTCQLWEKRCITDPGLGQSCDSINYEVQMGDFRALYHIRWLASVKQQKNPHISPYLFQFYRQPFVVLSTFIQKRNSLTLWLYPFSVTTHYCHLLNVVESI